MQIKPRAESGGFSSTLYWATEIIVQSDGHASVVTIMDKDEEGTNSDGEKVLMRRRVKHEGRLSAKQQKRLFAEADKRNLWSLPRTNYLVDMSDDCYHLGISVEARKEAKSFVHLIPTGVCVLVSNITPGREDVLNFLTFVEVVADAVEKISNLKVPPFIKVRWQTRRKEIERVLLSQYQALIGR